MRITWVTRSFLDYRIPVFKALDALCDNQLHLVFGTGITPERVKLKAEQLLGPRATSLGGERCIGDNSKDYTQVANKTITIPIQKGLMKAIKESHPDVLVCDGFFQWSFYAILHRLLHGTPVVMCYERTKTTERNCPLWRTLYRRLVSHCFNQICCNGKLSREYVHEVLKIPDSKLSCGHMAADTEALDAKEVSEKEIQAIREICASPDLLLLYVGRMIPLKGIDYLLKEFQEYQRVSTGSMSLLLVGDGPELKSYMSYQVPNVFFVGAKPYDEIVKYYKAADLFIIPTLEDNWSLVVPEAMACGLPIASSIYNGCWPELVTADNGWTFDPLAPGSIKYVLQVIFSNRERLSAMGEISRKIVQTGHTPYHAAQAIYSACKRCFRS